MATSLMETTVVEGIMGGVVAMVGTEGAMVGVDIVDGEAATTATNSELLISHLRIHSANEPCRRLTQKEHLKLAKIP